MAKQKKPHHRLDPDDVLEGRARPNARELLALIHDVNPTGHDHLSPREVARRYTQKSRLQSLLIHRFPDEILVEATDEEGVIGLRHRSSGADACHAVLASLDDDARSWAQFELDVGGDDAESDRSFTFTRRAPSGPAGPPSDAPLDAFSTDELLRRGRAALKDYDYPAARERFAAAFDRGNREAALLLLTVLVEHLGLDEDALALEDRLAREALEQPEIRLLLAQAAARTYERDRAVRLVRADTGDAAAEVFVALCRGALARGELDHAAAHVAEIQRRGPSHPALLDLADTIKRRRAEERAPLEAEAQRLFDEGRVGEAEARAEAITARWPESVVAHSIARAGQERRRREEAGALAREGHEALAAGEGARALGLLRRALTMGLREDDVAGAQLDLAQAEAEEREQIERDKAVAVARLIREGHMLRALTEYVALDDVRRQYVKEQHKHLELLYLDQTFIRGGGPDARVAAQAVMALVRATNALTNDPAGAVELVSAHWPVLHRVPTAREVIALGQHTDKLRRELEALQRYNAGIAALDGTEEGLARAMKLLAMVRRDDLNEVGRAALDEYTARTRRTVERMDRAKEVGKLRTAGDLIGARNALAALIRFEEAAEESAYPDNDEGEDEKGRKSIKRQWQEQHAEIVRSLARVADVRVRGAPPGDCLLGMEAPRLHDVPQSVLPGGEEIVLAEAHGGLIFVQILDVASGRVVRRASLRMRKPFEIGAIQQRIGRAAVLGSNGTYLEIDPRTWDIDRAVSTEFAEGTSEQGVLAPGGRFVWAILPREGWWTGVTVYDSERPLNVRNFSESVLRLSIRPLLGLAEPRVVVVRDRGTLTVYEARGAPVGSTQQDVPALLHGVVVHPTGKGLFALIRSGTADAPQVRWAELESDGTPLRAPTAEDRTIEGLDPDAPCETAVALDARVVYVLGGARGTHARRLIGFAARAAGIERCFDVEVPPRVTLTQDGAAKTVLALSPHEQGIEVVRLDASPPRFHAAAPATTPLDLVDLNLSPLRPCVLPGLALWTVDRDDGAGTGMGVEYLQHLGTDDRREMIMKVLEPDCRAMVVPRYASLWKIPKPAFAEDFAALALTAFPDDPEMLQIAAHRSAIAGDWASARDRLAPFDPAPLDDAPAQHHDHLLGAALLMTGDVEGARRVLARGAARAGGWCDLDAPLALAGEAEGAAPRPSYAAVRALDRAARAADACLAAGDFGGARRALSGIAVREAREVQTLARLCRAWLSEPDETEAGGAELDGFSRRLAFSVFIAAHAEKAPTRRRELPFPGARWDGAKLDALATEAEAWLTGDQTRPRAAT